jgi:hypothetical protein
MSDTNASTATADNSNGGNAATADSNAVKNDPATQTDGASQTTAADQKPGDSTVKADAPETYDLKMPDGVELDKAAAEEFTAIAKEMKLSAESAQKFADIGAKMAQRQHEAHAKTVEGWMETAKTDKEFGGDKFNENLAVAKKALETFGTPELRDVLNASGLGNHPEVIRAFYKAGKAISEDGFVQGGAKGADANDPAKKLFPNMN